MFLYDLCGLSRMERQPTQQECQLFIFFSLVESFPGLVTLFDLFVLLTCPCAIIFCSIEHKPRVLEELREAIVCKSRKSTERRWREWKPTSESGLRDVSLKTAVTCEISYSTINLIKWQRSVNHIL